LELEQFSWQLDDVFLKTCKARFSLREKRTKSYYPRLQVPVGGTTRAQELELKKR
jgi:hypothetical protein